MTKTIQLGSDNEANIRDEIMDAISEANSITATPSYGEDILSKELNHHYSELFEKQTFVFPTVSGTAANSIGLSSLTSSTEAILSHDKAHIHTSEAGSPEFFSGSKIITCEQNNGKLALDRAAAIIDENVHSRYHSNKISTISVTQATEMGGVYSKHELLALKDLASQHSLNLHMDGARFANAVAHLECTPASISWQSGIDILSFGSTKNGTMNAEAIIVFNEKHAQRMKWQLKQAGQLQSKARYLAAQLIALIKDDRWLNWAGECNQLTQQLNHIFSKHKAVTVKNTVEANLIIVSMPEELVSHLHDNNVVFYPSHEVKGCYRFVVSNSVDQSDINHFDQLINAWQQK